MLISCSLIIQFVRPISSILYSKAFYDAWIYTPFLLVSVVFGAMIGFYSSIYLANKKTKILFTSTLIGSIITLLLNFILIPLIGAIGSSISNALAYFSIWLFLHVDSRRFMSLNVNFKKNYVEYSLLFIQAGITVFYNSKYSLYLTSFCTLALIGLNIKNFKHIINQILIKIHKKHLTV